MIEFTGRLAVLYNKTAGLSDWRRDATGVNPSGILMFSAIILMLSSLPLSSSVGYSFSFSPSSFFSSVLSPFTIPPVTGYEIYLNQRIFTDQVLYSQDEREFFLKEKRKNSIIIYGTLGFALMIGVAGRQYRGKYLKAVRGMLYGSSCALSYSTVANGQRLRNSTFCKFATLEGDQYPLAQEIRRFPKSSNHLQVATQMILHERTSFKAETNEFGDDWIIEQQGN